MTSRQAARPILTALLCLLAVAAAAEDPDQRVPAGQPGNLSIQLHLHGKGPRGPVDRRMDIALPLVSQDTAFIHLLQSRADDDLRAHNDAVEALNAEIEAEALASVQEESAALNNMVETCVEHGNDSAACMSAGAELERFKARNDALKARIDDGEAQAAEIISAHRYQPFMAKGADVCGTLSAVIADPGGHTARLDLPSAGDAPGSNCFHQIVLDRKAGRVTLAVADLDIELPVPGAPRGKAWIARDDLPPRPKDDTPGGLILEDLPIQGNLRDHRGSTTVRLDNGLKLDVAWRFRAH